VTTDEDDLDDQREVIQYRDHVHTRKAGVALAGIIAITVLVLAERVDPVAGLAGIIAITMYILGNGVAAYKGVDVQPVIRSGVKYGRRVDD
jgi:hypothetical protein